MQREGEHAEPPDLGSLLADYQREDAQGTICTERHQHPESLPRAEVPPVDFQPIERLEERCPAGLAQQTLPILAEGNQLVDPVDFHHSGHGQAYFTTRNEE